MYNIYLLKYNMILKNNNIGINIKKILKIVKKMKFFFALLFTN
ncbi:hypothetical protein HMPREF0554_2359 [Pseudoleptotrichia goodfellowii F0264]|uniref:Uncharacterized protein n=1 Tax=Pseudoleptotrichia goodfellowii F0264 TaxID=596323 RepID=D0GNS6_9FUSO|nr:hypothetical protein HMPREF0554_2359 [Pseudoleptotrichia goodfellowii F0264]